MTEKNSEELLRELHAELHTLVTKVESAFTKDEDGNPDYSGHRKFHKEQDSAKEDYEESKKKIIRNIISWASIGILTVTGSALVQYFMLMKPLAP